MLDPPLRGGMLPDYALIEAVKRGAQAEFDDALELGASIHTCDIDGRSALEIAGERGRPEFVRQLIQLGADKNQPIGKQGEVLLHRAIRTGNGGFAHELLELEADASPINSAGRTPLHLAAMKGFQYLANDLLDHGASAYETTPQGDQPLHFAARRGDLPMIRTLLRDGASVEAANNTGYTPIHEAAAAGHTEAVEVLLKKVGPSLHSRSALLARVKRVAELHGQDDTAAAISAAEEGPSSQSPSRNR